MTTTVDITPYGGNRKPPAGWPINPAARYGASLTHAFLIRDTALPLFDSVGNAPPYTGTVGTQPYTNFPNVRYGIPCIEFERVTQITGQAIPFGTRDFTIIVRAATDQAVSDGGNLIGHASNVAGHWRLNIQGSQLKWQFYVPGTSGGTINIRALATADEFNTVVVRRLANETQVWSFTPSLGISTDGPNTNSGDVLIDTPTDPMGIGGLGVGTSGRWDGPIDYLMVWDSVGLPFDEIERIVENPYSYWLPQFEYVPVAAAAPVPRADLGGTILTQGFNEGNIRTGDVA